MNQLITKALCGAALLAGATGASASTKVLKFLPPQNGSEWHNEGPMISMNGGKTGTPMLVDADRCGWYYKEFKDEITTDNVLFFHKGDHAREDLIGMEGNEGDAHTPIPLHTLFAMVDTLYFIPDVDSRLDNDYDGWYETDPEVDGVCEISIPATVYDSDASLHPAFSCYGASGEGCQKGIEGVASSQEALEAINSCIGLTTGIVADTIDPSTRKPVLTQKGKKCFISETLFNQLFVSTEKVNESSCIDIPLTRTKDNRWAFDSYSYQSPATTAKGGFYPVENTPDYNILANTKHLPEARTKRAAESSVFFEPMLQATDEKTGYSKFDVLCSGPGWAGGSNCEGLFGDVPTTTAFIQSIIPEAVTEVQKTVQWEGMRNQHFCTESHLNFSYTPGQTFSVNSTNDTWVFIDGKLAIDLGGSHLDAPGFVNLDQFEGVQGKLQEGNDYRLEIFSCNRRTPMSELKIETNMFLQSSIPATIKVKSHKTGLATQYDICYAPSRPSCEPTFIDDDAHACTKPMNIMYILKHNNEVWDTLPTGSVSHGGIDLTIPSEPKINKSMLELTPGRWELYISIDGNMKRIETFRIGGTCNYESDCYVAPEGIVKANPSEAGVQVQTLGTTITITTQGLSTRNYAITDMMGRIIKTGALNNGFVSIPMEGKGRFFVRAGNQTRSVIIK